MSQVFKYLGSTKVIGRFGQLASGEVVTMTDEEAALIVADAANWEWQSSTIQSKTKNYIDTQSQGARDWKESVRVATTANITLSGAQTIDGVAVVAGNRVLVKNQGAGTENGIYVAATGAWSRSSDAATSTDVSPGMVVVVDTGTANAGTCWFLTTVGPIVLGTTALTFTKYTPDAAAAAAAQATADAAVPKSGGTMTGALTLPGIVIPFVTLTYAATVDIDFDGGGNQDLVLTGNATLTFSHLAAGKSVTVYLTASGADRTVTLPSGVKIFGSTAPFTLSSGKEAALTFTSKGTTAATVRGAYAAES